MKTYLDERPQGSVPSQVANPRRATIRTAVAVVFGIIAALPVLNAVLVVVADELSRQASFDVPAWVWVALNGALALIGIVTATVTRILAIPGVNTWLETHLPGLAPIRVGEAPDIEPTRLDT